MILAFSGGVGGAKLIRGLAAMLAPDELTTVVNVGDDFDHLGLRVCPDIDSVMYACADLNDAARGWGRRDESWNFHQSLPALGHEPWFQLGDRDLATHVLRTHWMSLGSRLSEVTARMTRALGIAHVVTPVTDDPVRTHVLTDAGELPFQDYFVRRRCEPVCQSLRFEGAETARLAPALAKLARLQTVRGFVICPSNPFLSIDPMLALPELRALLARRRAPCVAVSPLVAGQAIKGPAAKMMRELGREVSTLGIARHYQGLLDGLVIDAQDAQDAPALEALGLRVAITDTLMKTDRDRQRVARAALDLIEHGRPASP